MKRGNRNLYIHEAMRCLKVSRSTLHRLIKKKKIKIKKAGGWRVLIPLSEIARLDRFVNG